MELLDAHAQAMDVFDRAMHKVGLTDWDSPTPCTDWAVRDLVNHIVVEQLWVPDMLAGRTMAEVGDKFDGDQLHDDPPGAWQEASQTARAAWLQPGAVDRTVHLSFGDERAEEYGWQMTTDLAVHGWDLATATAWTPASRTSWRRPCSPTPSRRSRSGRARRSSPSRSRCPATRLRRHAS